MMKHTRQIDFRTKTALAMMSMALPLALLDIASSLFPESAVNRVYSSLTFSTGSSATATDAGLKPILFIVRKSDEGSQVIKLKHSLTRQPNISGSRLTNNVTPEISFRDTCGNALKT